MYHTEHHPSFYASSIICHVLQKGKGQKKEKTIAETKIDPSPANRLQ